MTNNDIFKKLRVALQLRDDQIVEILELVDFRISKGEIGNFFRNEEHEKYMECGDQVLRNFLNALVIYLRGTKENPKNAMDVIKQNQAAIQARPASDKPKTDFKPKTDAKKKPAPKKTFKSQKPEPIVEKVRYNNGKKKDNK
ncbi:hypothetical protein FCR2A7T_06440 [Flavobacterium cauense R2A-7]|uniref:Uncharacterized protein YehS (DUF1456 family) n=1 Tax=Flavobacterium cauense R2A-7 TaxID=1341154 RepID=V6S508_9FLAO|nr:DUF1456 family protein [Flavobacterium cauense]ESU21347.1 hypothetical protein FCR2A7T_06440 [Flavobacterium cauense R2A-7]KGO80006.1 hypothetical protein Q762_12995 [Flavobacterium cauense R2A-7]TWI08946.1 uncharacterized protein YehS (DUF1456 family) [Flavobacterium cauense R2A-7]